MKKYFLIFVIIGCFLSGGLALAETSNSTTGFIPSSIWYSQDPLISGETVKIYTVIWNGGKDPVSFNVEFYDKNVILGEREVIIPAEQLEDVSISWKVTSGDHLISAKIISSTINKDPVILERNETDKDRFFVPVLVKEEDGTTKTSSGALKEQLDKTTTKINNILPESVSTSISKNLKVTDNFRNKTLVKINNAKEKSQEEVDRLNKEPNLDEGEVLGALQKPIAQLKLFFFSALAFVFSHKILFYIISLLIIFYLLRFIYYRIRNR